jgi:hypothetical protein
MGLTEQRLRWGVGASVHGYSPYLLHVRAVGWSRRGLDCHFTLRPMLERCETDGWCP